jgi:hypothetical protein
MVSPDLQADLQALRLEPEPMTVDLNSCDLIADGDMEQLSLEIEKERYGLISVVSREASLSVHPYGCISSGGHSHSWASSLVFFNHFSPIPLNVSILECVQMYIISQ